MLSLRFALPLAFACTAMCAEAQTGMDKYFQTGGCFVREYTADHLAKHPDQLVKYISLSISALDAQPGLRVLDVIVNLRGKDEFFHGLAYCEPQGKGLACGMEGDAGAFVLEGAKQGALRLSVAAQGLSFEGQTDFITLDGRRGDDRVFLIPNVAAALCN
ncbi:MAG: hypothetical protein WCC57_09755 [Paracoccaceae bacterium]